MNKYSSWHIYYPYNAKKGTYILESQVNITGNYISVYINEIGWCQGYIYNYNCNRTSDLYFNDTKIAFIEYIP